MAKTSRPKFRINDLVMLAPHTPLIPSYKDHATGQVKPLVTRSKVLRVSSVAGKGTPSAPWQLRVTDDNGSFWILAPGDVELLSAT